MEAQHRPHPNPRPRVPPSYPSYTISNHSIVFGTFIFLNFFLIAAHSSGAVPIGTMFAIVLIWFLISVPLSVAGSFFGFRRPILEAPVRTNQIPRQIPEQVVYLRPIPSILLSGVLPFGAIFVELYFIMNSIWFHKAYYMFGFLFICYFIMVCGGCYAGVDGRLLRVLR